MDKIDQFCPHCGGGFALDSKQPLQSYLTCPYCGNRSLMQKTENGIRLRGIIVDSANKEEADPAWPPPRPAARVEPRPDLADLIAQADQPQQPEPVRDMEADADPEPDYTRLINKMNEAAQASLLPEFNSYSRQILDLKPDDWQVYSLRARLSEAAAGLADKSWANPVWHLYTARQKSAVLSRHFYAYNTALLYCPEQEKAVLAEDLASLIIRQAVDHLTQRALTRCSKRLFGRRFKGHFRRADLEESKEFCDAMSRIDPAVSPQGHELLRQAVKRLAAALPARLAGRLSKF